LKSYKILCDTRYDEDLCQSCSCKMLIDCAVRSEIYEVFIWKCQTCGELTFMILQHTSEN